MTVAVASQASALPIFGSFRVAFVSRTGQLPVTDVLKAVHINKTEPPLRYEYLERCYWVPYRKTSVGILF